MKKMNGKGFILAEAIVVAVFVLGMFTYLAVNIIPLITKYEQALKYDNPQEVYAANILFDEMNSFFLRDTSQHPMMGWDLFEQSFGITRNQLIDFNDIIDPNGTHFLYFKQLQTDLKITDIGVITFSDENKCITLERGLYDYCTYLETKGQLISNRSIDYINSSSTRTLCLKKRFLIKFNNEKYFNFSAYDCN